MAPKRSDRPANVLQTSIVRYVHRGAWGHAGRLLEKSHPAEIAEVLDRLTPGDRKAVFELIRSDAVRGEVLALVQFANWADLVRGLDAPALARIVVTMSPDDAAELLRELPREHADLVLQALGERAEDVESLLGYAEQTAGALMSTDFFALQENLSVKEAAHRIQQLERPDASFYVYVTTEGQQLVGVLSLRQLIVQPPHRQLRDFMTTDPIRVRTDADQEEVSRIVSRYDLLAVPVVDNANRLLGVVTVDDVIDAIRDETTEGAQKFGGMQALGAPYLETSLLTMIRKRAIWLAALFLGEMLTASAMGHYEAEIAHAVVLALFVPLIISSGGNSGSQAATLVVRAMALGEVKLRDWWRIMRREVLAGLALGLILAVIGLVRILLWQALFGTYGSEYLLVGETVAASLVGVVMWGAIAGSMLPFALRRLGVDPASASAPFVATLVDVSGLVIYFSVASVVMHGTLL